MNTQNYTDVFAPTILVAGSRNETGFINSLDRQGFTLLKCLAELIANLNDAYSANGRFKRTASNIKLCDDGSGMTVEKLTNMFDANRENHQNDKSMGVSGIGGTVSTYQLSKDDNGNPRTVNIYTKHTDGPYLKATVPWDYIYTNKIYDGQINIVDMSQPEIDDFDTDRINFEYKTGTTFCFPYSENFDNLLASQFQEKEEDASNLDNWLAVIFGKTKTNISLDKGNGLPPISLKKYDYFSGSNAEYYCGKFEWNIYYIYDGGKHRFICKDPKNTSSVTKYIEITEDGKGHSKEPKTINIDPRKLVTADIIKFTSAMRINKAIFDPANPRELLSATFYLNDYDAEFMSDTSQKDVIKEFYSKTGVIRNGQKVTGVNLDGCKASSSRGNASSLIKTLHISEISYETFSSQENKLDIIHGIQQNKNQNQNDFPKQYVRLIKFLKEHDYQRNSNYFEEVIAAKRAKEKAEKEKRRKEDEERKAKEAKEKAEQEAKEKAEREAKEKAEREAKEKAEREAKEANESDEEEEAEEEAAEEEAEEEEAEEEEAEEEAAEEEEAEEEAAEEEEAEEETVEEEAVSEVIAEAVSEVIAEAIEEIVEEVVEETISTSKEWEKKAAQMLMESIADINYNRVNGKELYEYVLKCINNK